MIQPDRILHDIATDASGLKGIGGVYKRQVFAERIPARHRIKHHRLERNVCYSSCIPSMA